jgi:hypothetical protein
MDALTLLHEAGWFPGRSVDVAGDLAALTAEGFPITPATHEFLSEFSGLQIIWETKDNPLTVNGAIVAGDADIGWCEAYSTAIGSQLVPVGEYAHMTLYVDPDGGLWGGVGNEYGQIGSSLVDVIERIFLKPRQGFDRRLDLE